MSDQAVRKKQVLQVDSGHASPWDDALAVEEPLEIRLDFQAEGWRRQQTVSITMRTPGHDAELAAGFLHGEEIVSSADQIESISNQDGPDGNNRIEIRLVAGTEFDPLRLQRNFYTTSSCGICSKASLQALEISRARIPPPSQPVVEAAVIESLPSQLRQAQSVFARTGGLHAAGLFSPEGKLLRVREDVGRHNAVDKVLGEQLLAGRLPLFRYLLMVSGRTSFEILQKALTAGVPIVAAVSAPSSLAVDLAQEYGLTLLGFVRGRHFNIYAGAERIRLSS